MATLCIQPSANKNEHSALKYYVSCMDDDKERKDLKEDFFDIKKFEFFDIKLFSQTNLQEYKTVFNTLKEHLNTYSTTVHLSNVCHTHEDFYKGYESFDKIEKLLYKVITLVQQAKHKHRVEIHIKRKHDQDWNEQKHNECVQEIFNRLDTGGNIISLIAHECEITWTFTDTGNFDMETHVEEKDVNIFNKTY